MTVLNATQFWKSFTLLVIQIMNLVLMQISNPSKPQLTKYVPQLIQKSSSSLKSLGMNLTALLMKIISPNRIPLPTLHVKSLWPTLTAFISSGM